MLVSLPVAASADYLSSPNGAACALAIKHSASIRQQWLQGVKPRSIILRNGHFPERVSWYLQSRRQPGGSMQPVFRDLIPKVSERVGLDLVNLPRGVGHNHNPDEKQAN